MKLREFDSLCQVEWVNGKGDVKTLWLLEKSLKELQADIAETGMKKSMMLPVKMEHLTDLRAGSPPWYVINPRTRSEVKLHIARDMDVADVYYGDRYETHILARS